MNNQNNDVYKMSIITTIQMMESLLNEYSGFEYLWSLNYDVLENRRDHLIVRYNKEVKK